MKNKQSPNSEDSTALGSFLNDLDNTTHDLLMIALNLEMDTEQSSSDKQNKSKTIILS
jgi:hypothetical protein